VAATGCSRAKEVESGGRTASGGLPIAGETGDLAPELVKGATSKPSEMAALSPIIDDDMAPMSMEWTVDIADLVAEVTVVAQLDQVQNTATGALEFSPEEYLDMKEVHALEKIVPVVLEINTIYTPTLARPPIDRVIVRMLNGIDMPEGYLSEIGVEYNSDLTLDQLPIGSKALVLLALNDADDYTGFGFAWIGLFREMAEAISAEENRRYESGQFQAWYTEDGGPYEFTDGSTRSYPEILDYARSLSGGG
jgi:hypothetical protein